MAHAKYVDGEAIAVLRRNPLSGHPIELDVVLYETEQCATPYLPFGQAVYVDGIRFDEFGNPRITTSCKSTPAPPVCSD